jgi:hypothetical protein
MHSTHCCFSRRAFLINQKKKGPLASKRPKSREETPKEGGGT